MGDHQVKFVYGLGENHSDNINTACMRGAGSSTRNTSAMLATRAMHIIHLSTSNITYHLAIYS